ncbi:hypothetical protein SLEP1_g34537 [Rubroshorea leprosula]|uniref:Uncharacterized protein n=1 Tax=Rubroshorea leprosula TaxID=152421 RepID=A0AAV5KK95_9ROSI|nr:hypothetical protein SLEP1_g34537 [Rubroshorea leprosula]
MLFNLNLSPIREVRFRSESEIEQELELELELAEDPDYIPPPTSCSESYKTEDMSSEETLSVREVKGLSTSTRDPIVQRPSTERPRVEPMKRRTEDDVVAQKKISIEEQRQERREEVLEFVPRPLLVEINLALWEIKMVTHERGKSCVPLPTQ